jgi:tRNA (adenine37-N6)-methyltransferase
VHSITFTPIGIIHTPYRKTYDAPRQPGIDDRREHCTVVLNQGPTIDQALSDLEGFERIWLLYVFDRVTSWKPKVLPPRSDVKRGVFATRSPHRPNPIGMSVVTLLDINGRMLTIGPTDILDGTPLLDVKPYVASIDSFPDSRSGWVDLAPGPSFTVVWDVPPADHALARHVERVLSFDPAPHPYRRTRLLEGGLGEIAFTTWRCRYVVSNRTVRIVEVFSV